MDLVTLATAAEIIGCSRQAVSQMVRSGNFPRKTEGKYVLVSLRVVGELAARSHIRGRKPTKNEDLSAHRAYTIQERMEEFKWSIREIQDALASSPDIRSQLLKQIRARWAIERWKDGP